MPVTELPQKRFPPKWRVSTPLSGIAAGDAASGTIPRPFLVCLAPELCGMQTERPRSACGLQGVIFLAGLESRFRNKSGYLRYSCESRIRGYLREVRPHSGHAVSAQCRIGDPWGGGVTPLLMHTCKLATKSAGFPVPCIWSLLHFSL